MKHPTRLNERRRVTLALAGLCALPLSLSLTRDGAAAESSSQRGLSRRSALLLAAAQRGLCSSANQSGVGLRGEYFAAERPGGAPLLVRTDSAIDFDAQHWVSLQAAQGRQPRSARWTGWIKPLVAGPYAFAIKGNHRVRATVAQQEVIGTDLPAGSREIVLSPGRFYPVSIEIHELRGTTSPVQFEWQLPYGARAVVPQANLFLPTDQVST